MNASRARSSLTVKFRLSQPWREIKYASILEMIAGNARQENAVAAGIFASAQCLFFV